MLDPPVPIDIQRQLLRPMGVVSVNAMPPGLSGANVFRCRLASGEDRVLRQWPAGVGLDRVAQVATVIRHSRKHGIDLVPALFPVQTGSDRNFDSQPEDRIGAPGVVDATCMVCEGTCWQMMQWMPGKPLPISCGLDRIERGGEVIAAFHASVAAMGATRQPSAVVCSRLRRARELKPLIRKLNQSDCDRSDSVINGLLEAAVYRARQTLLWRWAAAAEKIERSLEIYKDKPLHSQWVLRDIHRENALFLDGQPSGLIDFDAVRIDTPWADLARWAGSFLGGPHASSQVWDAAIAGFCGNNPLKHSQEMQFGVRLVKELSFATNWLALANWVVWLVIEKRRFPAADNVLAGRIDELRRIVLDDAWA